MSARAARLLVVVAALAVGNLADAAQRTFVASYGVTANTAFNCSLGKPCRAFGEAIGVTDPGGEVIVLDSAGYGPVTIAQSVSIIAPAGAYAGVTVFSGDGITVNGAGITVVLRGLTINGQGGSNGIAIANADTVHVENCVIAHMSNDGINQLAGTLFVKDTIVRDNGQHAIIVFGPAAANVDRSRFDNNQYGLYAANGGQTWMHDSVASGNGFGVVATVNVGATPSATTIARSLISNNNFGVYVECDMAGNTTRVDISDSEISGSATEGLHIQAFAGAVGIAEVVRTTISRNATGVKLTTAGATVLLDNDLITQNGTGISGVAGSVVSTRSNNTLHGNVTPTSGTATSPTTVLAY